MADNSGEEADNSGEVFVATAEHDFKWKTQSPKDHFEKLLEATCPHHQYPVKHNLKDCTMMKKFMTSGAPTRGSKLEGDPGEKSATPIPRGAEVMIIFG
jgi:hypothetical protein